MKKFAQKRKLTSRPDYLLRETAYRFLFEQDDEDEEGDEEGGGDEGEDEAVGDDEGDDKKDDEGDDKDKDEKEKVSIADKLELVNAVDAEINTYLVGAEKKARKSAAVNKDVAEMHLESRSLRFLVEGGGDEDVDLQVFASEVARFIENYQNLIDWKSVILNKVETFITTHYDEDTAKNVLEILELDFGISKDEGKEEPSETPVAVGASASAAGGG